MKPAVFRNTLSKLLMLMVLSAAANGAFAMIKNIERLEVLAKKNSSLVKQFIDGEIDKDGLKMLHICVQQEDSECVERLLALGADPNIRDAKGKAPLYYAAAGSEKSMAIAESLLGHGAKCDIQDYEGLVNLGVIKIILDRSSCAEPADNTGCSWCGGLLGSSRFGELKLFSCGHKVHLCHTPDFKPDAAGDCFDCWVERTARGKSQS